MQHVMQHNVSPVRPPSVWRRWSTYAIGAVVLAVFVLSMAMASPANAASINVSTYGAKGDGVSDDTRAIQAAINAAASSKGTVTFSEGTYRITSTLYPRSDMTISGVPGRTTIAMPAQSSLTYMLYTENASNLTLSGLGFRAGGHTSNVSGLYLPGAKNCRADNLYFEGLSTGVKLGSGNVATGWEMSDITVRNTRMPMFISHVHDSTFTRLNLQAIHLPDTKLDHALYMERESRQLNFRDCTLSGGSGYSLQLWLGGGSSSDIAFSNLTVNASTGMYPVVIGPGFSNVYFNNTRLIARPSDEIVRFYGGTNVVFDGFSASGGDVLALVVREVNNVTFRNGTYTGSNLGSGVTLENVSTNTTIAPATTTAASTTTTTVAPTTVTTVPQQTQATVTTLPATTSTTTPTPPTTVKSSTVTVTAPANDAIVRGRVGIQAGVTSSRSVFKVRFYVDNRYVGQDYRSPFTLSWNTGRLAPGSNHTISVVATDFFGREIGRDSVNVTIAG